MFKRVAELSQLEDDEILPVEVDGIEMIVYRNGESIRACQRHCVHQGADLSEGLVSSGFLICAQHAWRFDADSGVHERSPATCLATYEVQVDGTDILINPTPIRNGAQS